MWSYSYCSMVCIMCSYDGNPGVAFLVATYLLKINLLDIGNLANAKF